MSSCKPSSKRMRTPIAKNRETRPAVSICNLQRDAPVDIARMKRLARRAIKRLGIRGRGALAITFINSRLIRQLNRQFLGHDWTTDVLSFRYDKARGSGLEARPPRLLRKAAPGGHCPQPSALSPQPIVGEILVSPRAASAYARRHDIPYQEELSRYVVHGLLHWMGHEDKTAAQQRAMRAMEDRLLIH